MSSCIFEPIRTITKMAQTGVPEKPFNIASYALLTMMIVQVCDLKLGDFVHTLATLRHATR